MRPADRQHPADDQLIALYFGDGEEVGLGEQRTVRQHVHGCEACTWRYAELIAPLERLRADAASEADEVFTPERLERQRLAIRERLETGTRASRVVAFPAGSSRASRIVTSRPRFRWVAAAAAAGLIVGASAGWFIGLNRAAAPSASQAAVARPAGPAAPVPASYEPSVDRGDELLLAELETGFTTRRIAALSALDELTPKAREAVLAKR